MPVKKPGPDGVSRVTFSLPGKVAADTAALCGDFNDWSATAHPLKRRKNGDLAITVDLTEGREYRYRYLLDGQRWENDWAADDYQPNAYGGDDSVIRL